MHFETGRRLLVSPELSIAFSFLCISGLGGTFLHVSWKRSRKADVIDVSFFNSKSFGGLLHSECFEDRVDGIGIERGLELGKKLAGDGR